ncbi:ABC transporter substrate-binding protein [Rhodovulum viride]|uniref:ABC transporter substrate-binding protein n=1 Tax=Rhodovulum viride TaxID=1231134 RepID=A0ABX9DC97_9RHOB|nr:ABC transporter substrate-binding protein [Rhodovulum viride]RAP39947.1 ABC transporter substrate-binding protein [Rhodovulum viride]
MLKRLTGAALAVLALLGPARAEDLPQLRAAVLKIGTVTWELETIKAHGFDRAHGFELVLAPYADNGATRVAFEGGAAETMVADWIWVARQRAAGRPYVAIPYSTAVGGLVVPADSDAETLADLAGRKIGIAGGPLDKSWLILRAYAQAEYGMDLAARTEQVFGAPPLIFKAGMSGELQGAINFWHFLARMRAGGMRELVSVSEASAALGLDPGTPLLAYVLDEGFVATHPGIDRALYAASRDAKDLLATDDAAWDEIRPLMNAGTDAEFEALRADWRAGVPAPGNVAPEAADRLLRLMAELGGADLVGEATTLPEGTFAVVE